MGIQAWKQANERLTYLFIIGLLLFFAIIWVIFEVANVPDRSGAALVKITEGIGVKQQISSELEI